MLVNADFSKAVVVTPDDYHWVASPQAGVERVMLDRVGAEQARATSLVRYAACSHFPRHEHPGGEEILVLEGTFCEGERHYPAGFYLRNPPGSSHQPSSHDGALIFVKLRQMTADDTATVAVDTRDPACWEQHQGREVCWLYQGEAERVCLQRLAPGRALDVRGSGGAEVLVVAGQVLAPSGALERGSWMRLPRGGDCPALQAGEQGATVYLKTGHLPSP